MKCKDIIIQLFNRIVGVVVLVALWNILYYIIKEDDMILNTVIAIIGLIICGLLGEYTVQQQNGFGQLTPLG